MKENRISSEMSAKMYELAKETQGKMADIVEDHWEVRKSLGAKPKSFEYLEVYDSTLITLIYALTETQLVWRKLFIEKMREKEGSF